MSTDNAPENLMSVADFPAPPPPTQSVKCPTHNTYMTYVASRDIMECTAPDCKMVSVRDPRFSANWGAKAGMVYRGPLRYMRDMEGTMYLYLVDLGVYVDATEILGRSTPAVDPPDVAVGLDGSRGEPAGGSVSAMSINFMPSDHQRHLHIQHQLREAGLLVGSFWSDVMGGR